ncbi:MAG: DUF4160 domain-containing protein [Burkholderiales bacterium]
MARGALYAEGVTIRPAIALNVPTVQNKTMSASKMIFLQRRWAPQQSPDEIEAMATQLHTDGEAKFWLTPQMTLARQVGLSERQIADAKSAVERHIEEITNAWNKHFGS